MKTQNGFTLIEILVSLTLLAIVATFAATTYGEYLVRTQAAEALNMAPGPLKAFEEVYVNFGVVPINNAEAGLPASANLYGKYVASIAINGGGVLITYRTDAHPDIQGKTINFTPYATAGGALLWACGLAGAPTDPLGVPLSPPVGIVPGTTTLPTEALPSECRA